MMTCNKFPVTKRTCINQT